MRSMMNVFLLSTLITAGTVTPGCQGPGAAPDPTEGEGEGEGEGKGNPIDATAPDEILFQEGLTLFDAVPPDLVGAQERFDRLVAEFAVSPRHDNAGYLTGRCRYERAQASVVSAEVAALYAEAIVSFTAMRDGHPTSSFASSAAFFSGRARFELADWTNAALDFEAAAADADGVYVDNAAYYVGRTRYEDRQFVAAIAALEGFEATYPTSTYLDNGRYYLGRSHFDLARAAATSAADEDTHLLAAIPPLQRVLGTAGSIYADNAAYYIGRAQYHLGAFAEALVSLQRVIDDYPDSQYVDNALYFQARADVDLADCPAAQAVVADLRTRFPSSPELSKAEGYLANGGC